MEYTVVSMKWGKKYGADYVNRLYNMVKRNTTLPFKFICYTDDANGLLPEIQARPLPEMDLPEGPERGWRKLSLFKKDIDLSGRILFLDLDTVIVRNIDDYFTIDGDFILIRHWKPSKTQGIGETGVYRFEAGAHADLYENFMANIDEVKANFRHEQAYVCDALSRQNKLSFWPSEWMPSFKYDCMRWFILGLFLEPKLPEKAKMIVFHGHPMPEDALKGKMRGFKKLFRFVKPAKWLKDAWR
ncbi:MAG: glycosyltransferase [Verrucomicrobiaceae bacterium]|nr:glycosyltransferase [Verrucomicrobiaceae bacterium]